MRRTDKWALGAVLVALALGMPAANAAVGVPAVGGTGVEQLVIKTGHGKTRTHKKVRKHKKKHHHHHHHAKKHH